MPIRLGFGAWESRLFYSARGPRFTAHIEGFMTSASFFRPLRPADESVLRAIHARQRRSTGFEYHWPELFRDPNYYRVLVCEREGQVEGCIVAHATTEMFLIADRPRMLRALTRHKPELEDFMRRAGADEIHAFVPRSLLSRMRSWLARMGFRPSSPRCITFYREL